MIFSKGDSSCIWVSSNFFLCLWAFRELKPLKIHVNGKPSRAPTRKNIGELGVLRKANCRDAANKHLQNPVMDSSAEIASFEAAANAGNFLDAQQKLQSLEAANVDLGGISVALIERVKRITSQFAHSFTLLDRQVKDLSIFDENEKLGIKWGYELRNSGIFFSHTFTLPNSDLVRAYAALRERDLLLQFNPSVHHMNSLKDESPHECFVQYFSSSSVAQAKGDHVVLMSTLDDLGVSTSDKLWLGQCTPQESTGNAQGVSIPSCRRGFLRTPYMFQTMTFSPLEKKGDRSRGFQMQTAIEVVVPRVPLAVLSIIPNFVMKMICRLVIEDLSVKFRDFVQNSVELQERLINSPHACFYEHLYKRLTAGNL